MKLMQDNIVWNLDKLFEGSKSISCKWIFKTKWNLQGNVDRYKTSIIINTQKKVINYKKTFSPISSKDFHNYYGTCSS